MRIWISIMVSLGLIIAAIGCDKSIHEPGEPEHGGVFLHGNPDNNPTTR
jgi:hypothetical protein